MRPNKTRAKLQAGETVFGCLVRFPDPALVELMGLQEWDFLILDAEHGPLSVLDCENMVRAAEVRGVTPIVRVPNDSSSTILRYLDTGAQGVHVPCVESASNAQTVVRSVKYHPLGTRGLAGVRAADYGQGSLSEYVRSANAETLVTLHIETAAAIERLPEILAVDGIDVIFVGSMDLSNSLGVPGEVEHPKVQAAIDRIVRTVETSATALGIVVGDAESARAWNQRGARYIAIGFEALIRGCSGDYLRSCRITNK